MDITKIAENGSRIRIPGYGNELQTETEVELTEEAFGQIKQKINRSALEEYESGGFRKIPTEEKSLSGVLRLVDQMKIMLQESEELSD